ncbi:MAG: glycerophosphodiester phosphodiesterase [Hymenobacter sp.]|nr:MAG: glycerophosphodiester phosphodiesterase [Hymenobacter sp.]
MASWHVAKVPRFLLLTCWLISMLTALKNPFRLPQIHGHRGCRGLFPENTLPAFLHAVHLGVEVLELDVVISADHQVVVAHDPWLPAHLGLSPTGQRIDACRERDYNIYRLPYSTIKQSMLGILPQPLFPEQQLVPTYRPLLREVLEATEATCQSIGRAPVGYSIEIKSTAATDTIFHPTPILFTELVLQAIPTAIVARTTILSFDERILQAARSIQPITRVCLLVETPFSPEQLFDSLGFIPAVFGPEFQLLNHEALKSIRELYPSLSVVPWTINEPSAIERAVSWQVDGITTDYPNRAIFLLAQG